MVSPAAVQDEDNIFELPVETSTRDSFYREGLLNIDANEESAVDFLNLSELGFQLHVRPGAEHRHSKRHALQKVIVIPPTILRIEELLELCVSLRRSAVSTRGILVDTEKAITDRLFDSLHRSHQLPRREPWMQPNDWDDQILGGRGQPFEGPHLCRTRVD
jgi:hypothetical protein